MSKTVHKNKVLFDADEEEEDNSVSFKNGLGINKNYADRYDKWRGKEELQRLKDKYGDVNESDESTDESEDEDAKELTNDVEMEFFKALSLVKSKDSKIYDKEKCKFFENMPDPNQEENETNKNGIKKEKEPKQFLLKDLEREMILEKIKKSENGEQNLFDDENEELKSRPNKNKLGYYEEQDAIKKSIKAVVGSEDEDDHKAKNYENDADFLKVKSKTKEDKAKEEADYIEWLKGKRNKVENPDLEKNMKYLHDYWNDPKLNEGERFLRDYILNKRYLDKEESEEEDDEQDEEEKSTETKETKEKKGDTPLDYVDFSEEEEIVEKQEEFERKYNFRFEDPDPEFIKSYPRTVADSMRRKDTKRKEKRDEYKKRKELEKLKKKEEIKRLKSLKRKEIQDKIEKLKKVTGMEDIKLTVEDLEKDFDPDEYEKTIEGNMFNDDYYQVNQVNNDDNEDDKPVFTDDDEEDLKYENWDEFEIKPTKKKGKEKEDKKKKRKRDEVSEEEPEFNMDCEPVDKKSKKTLLAQALLREKPIFDENEKSFEEYFDEYYKLDCEDIIGGDLPCRFKYREVVPNDFGLSLEEIFKSKDIELNQWASLKKVTQYRSTVDEINDLKLYKNKKNQIDSKKKILTSCYNEEEEEEEEIEEDEGVNEEHSTEDPVVEQVETEETVTTKKKHKKKDKKEKKETIQEQPEEELPVETTKETELKVDVEHSDNETKKSSHKKKHKKKNKNILESITDERLLAYGIEPKKFHKKIKYSNKNS